MRKSLHPIALALWAVPAFAQPTGQIITQWNDAGPFRGTVAQMPPCLDGRPRIFLVVDGASGSDCSTGGGATEVPCFCLDGAYVAGGGSGGGATALDDLTDVSTAGAASGEALAYTGAGWEPTAAAVIQEGDARLADARTPTAHAPSHEDGGTDEIDLTGLAGLTATPQTPAAHVHAAGDVTSGTLAHERGGLEADASAFGGLVQIAAGSTSAVSDLAGLNTALGSSIADGAHTVDTDDQIAAEVPYTPTTGADWADPDPTAVGGALDDLAGRVTADEGALSTHAGNADAHHAEDHASRHSLGGGDPVTVTNLASGCTDAQVLGGTAAGTGVECQADATLSGASAGGDLSGTYPNPSLAADTVGLAELAACAGPDEIVEYGASGVPSCIPTPSGGGGSGDVTGPGSSTASGLVVFSGTSGKVIAEAAGLTYTTFGGYPMIVSSGDHQFNVPSAARSFKISYSGGTLMFQSAPFITRITMGGTISYTFDQTDFSIASGLQRTWSSTSTSEGSPDVGFKRGAAGRVDVTNGSTGTGSILALMAQLAPQASAPTCPASSAGLYFDSSGSGALCACPPGGAWSILFDFGSGNCT